MKTWVRAMLWFSVLTGHFSFGTHCQSSRQSFSQLKDFFGFVFGSKSSFYCKSPDTLEVLALAEICIWFSAVGRPWALFSVSFIPWVHENLTSSSWYLAVVLRVNSSCRALSSLDCHSVLVPDLGIFCFSENLLMLQSYF